MNFKGKWAGWQWGDKVPESHYPVRVTAVLVVCWAPVGLAWFPLLDLSIVCTAFFTHSTCGSAQTLRPRLVINLQCKEKIDKLSHILKGSGPGVKIRSYIRDLRQKLLDKMIFQIHKTTNKNIFFCNLFYHKGKTAPGNTQLPCSA